MKERITLACVAIILWILPPASAEPAPGEQAREILEATGIQGGLIVHLGCGDGRLAAALRLNDRFLVEGLDTDTGKVAAAEQRFTAPALAGSVTFRVFDGRNLPYIDNVVNLLVVEDEYSVSTAEMMRVLVPRGTICLMKGRAWEKRTKPVPASLDEWTHFLHGPDGNAVAADSLVGPPFHMQWVGSPIHSKSHSHLSSINVIVSAAGRIFYIADEGPLAMPFSLPSRWALFARDAFNGVTLWRRPLKRWQASDLHSRQLFPVDLYRRLVADGRRVYATLDIFGPVEALDAATGQTLRTYAGTQNTAEIILADGTLYLVVHAGKAQTIDRRAMAMGRTQVLPKRLMAVRADTGEVLWQKSGGTVETILPMTLAAKAGRLFFATTRQLVALDARSGDQLWLAPRRARYARPSWSAPTLVAGDEVVLLADRQTIADIRHQQKKAGTSADGELAAFSAKTGRLLWSVPAAEGCGSPIDVFVSGGMVWFGQEKARKEPDYRKALDLQTGKVARQYESTAGWVAHHHHRCYRDKATESFILAGRTGVEFLDLETGRITPHHWIRGICKYGILPCNGLLYLPPDQCGCYIDSKLTGFHALAPRRPSESPTPRLSRNRLERGPAYAKAAREQAGPADKDWPTYRADAARSGSVPWPVPVKLQPAWSARLGGRLTQPVVAAAAVFAASIDEHKVFALDAQSGRKRWVYTAGGRVDSPPTVAAGLVVFGCRDGWVYALRASDGQLAWRFRAAPNERRLVAQGQLESVWPVAGSVLVRDGVVYCAAGRSSYLDGGVWMYKLDLGTGRKLLEKRFYSRDPETGRTVHLFEPYKAEILPDRELPGVLPDVLSSDGRNIWMRSVTFGPDLAIKPEHPAHLFGSMGFLDDSWWERTYWIYGPHFFSGAAGVHFAKHVSPAGRILVLDETSVYGYQDETFDRMGLFACGKEPHLAPLRSNKFNKAKYRNARKTKVVHDWFVDVPFYVQGLVLADRTLFAAGPPRFDEDKVRAYLETCSTDDAKPLEMLAEALETFAGARGAVMWAIEKTSGRKLAEYRLESPPVFDGLIAANGRLYAALRNGKLLCWTR